MGERDTATCLEGTVRARVCQASRGVEYPCPNGIYVPTQTRPFACRFVYPTRSQYSNNGTKYFRETPSASRISDGDASTPPAIAARNRSISDFKCCTL